MEYNSGQPKFILTLNSRGHSGPHGEEEKPAGMLAWLIMFHPHTINWGGIVRKRDREKQKMEPGSITSKCLLSPNHILLLARLHLPNVPQFPKRHCQLVTKCYNTQACKEHFIFRPQHQGFKRFSSFLFLNQASTCTSTTEEVDIGPFD